MIYLWLMVVLIKKTLSEFASRHPSAAEPLNKWYEITKNADWSKLADIKKMFNNVD